jgi:hypothetical protein
LLGGQAYVTGDLVLAREREERALALFRSHAGEVWQAAVEWYLRFIALVDGRVADAGGHYERSLRLWLDVDFRSHWFKSLVHLADVAAICDRPESAALLLGAADQTMADTGARLFPFDVPVYERATERSRSALGYPAYAMHTEQGRLSMPEDWLAVASTIDEAPEVCVDLLYRSNRSSRLTSTSPCEKMRAIGERRFCPAP